MKKWVGTFFIDFKCDVSQIDTHIQLLTKEINKFDFNGYIDFIKYEQNSCECIQFVAMIRLTCSDEHKLDQIIINTYVMFNHIVKQINKNNNLTFDWFNYDDYNCVYDHKQKLEMVYSKNPRENMCGFPIKCNVGYSLQDTDSEDSFQESLDEMFDNLSL
jgi:hypothetical protein